MPYPFGGVSYPCIDTSVFLNPPFFRIFIGESQVGEVPSADGRVDDEKPDYDWLLDRSAVVALPDLE